MCRLRFHTGDAGTPRSDWHRGKSLRWKFHVENGGGTKGVSSQSLADWEHDTRRKHGTLSLVLLCLRIDFPWRYTSGKCHHGRRAHLEEQMPCFLLRFGGVFWAAILRGLRFEREFLWSLGTNFHCFERADSAVFGLPELWSHYEFKPGSISVEPEDGKAVQSDRPWLGSLCDFILLCWFGTLGPSSLGSSTAQARRSLWFNGVCRRSFYIHGSDYFRFLRHTEGCDFWCSMSAVRAPDDPDSRGGELVVFILVPCLFPVVGKLYSLQNMFGGALEMLPVFMSTRCAFLCRKGVLCICLWRRNEKSWPIFILLRLVRCNLRLDDVHWTPLPRAQERRHTTLLRWAGFEPPVCPSNLAKSARGVVRRLHSYRLLGRDDPSNTLQAAHSQQASVFVDRKFAPSSVLSSFLAGWRRFILRWCFESPGAWGANSVDLFLF